MILSVCTVLMLLHVLPIWRRVAIVTALGDDYADTDDDTDVDAHHEDLIAQTASRSRLMCATGRLISTRT